MQIRKATVWTETMPPRCTGMMLNDKGIDRSITSTDDIMFGEGAYTRIVRIALTDGEKKVSEVAAFTGPCDGTKAEIVDCIQDWAFIVSLDGEGIESLVSLTKADRKLIMERMVRSAVEYEGNTSYVMGIRDAERVGEIKVGKESCKVFGARVIG